jgi:DDE superfamily endonuclease
MNLASKGTSEVRFAAYVEGLSSVLGHADRIGPLRDYCTGLILPGERKSVEPMAAKTAPARTAAQHQSLGGVLCPRVALVIGFVSFMARVRAGAEVCASPRLVFSVN